MSRYIGQPDSIFSGAQSFIAQGILTAIASGSIGSGELCTLFQDGSVRRTDPTLSWDKINQNNPTTTVIQASTVDETIDLADMTVSTACGYPIKMINGFFVIPLQTQSGIGFTIRSSEGQETSTFISVSNDSSTDRPYAIALAAGGFALIWNAAATLKFVVCDANGNTLTSVTTITTSLSVSGFVPWHGHCQLVNGNIAFTYSTTSNDIRAQIFTISASVAVAEFSVASALCQNHVCAPCINGDFLVGAFDGSNNLWKCWRYNASGASQWGPHTPANCRGALFTGIDAGRLHRPEMRLSEISCVSNKYSGTNNICWMLPHTDQYCKAFVFNHAGTDIGFCDPGPTYHDTQVPHPLCLTPDGFCFSHGLKAQPDTYCSFWDPDGNCLRKNCHVDGTSAQPPTNTTPVLHTYAIWTGVSVCITRYVQFNGNVEARAFHCDQNGNLIGGQGNASELSPGIQILQALTGNDMCGPVPECWNDGVVLAAWFTVSTTVLTISTTKTGCSSVIGVAQAAASNGQSVTIVAEGYFTLPGTQIFSAAGQAFDQRNAPVVGCRGVVGGSTAVLFGWL